MKPPLDVGLEYLEQATNLRYSHLRWQHFLYLSLLQDICAMAIIRKLENILITYKNPVRTESYPKYERCVGFWALSRNSTVHLDLVAVAAPLIST